MQGTTDPTRVELLDAAALCRHLVPDGSVHGFLADHRRELFPDELFADLFGSGRGRPSVPADVVATVMVLQALEGLSDREAVQQLACNIAWKVACGLALTDRGFHPTVLSLWRTRLRASDRPERVFDAVRAVIAQTGVLAGRQRRALDSTLLDDAVATQDTVTQLVAAVRRVRRLVLAAGALKLAAHDYDHDPGKPACAWDDPEARTRLVGALVSDALAVLEAVEDLDLDADQAEAVGLLGLVAGQDIEPGAAEGSFRIARKVAADRVISVVDPDARHMHKSRSSYRDGYKAHLAVEPETGLITATELTPANAADGPTGVGLLAGEPPGLQVLGDAAYGGGETRATLRAAGHVQLIKPIPLPAAVPGGFTRDDFTVDLQANTVTCPAGHTMAITPGGRAVLTGAVAPARCGPAAPPPNTAEPSTSIPTKTSSPRRGAPPPIRPSRPATDAGGRWWSGRSPGWSPRATAGCATAAWPATSSACRCGWPRSTYAGWSPWAWSTAMPGGCSPNR
jgi:IS5 family transposase